ncbi:(d)CMP kinase [Sandaracinobacter neustonicus]|uniref:Cytidylate kinase n=1 Tax=Sandaracinobacter neustonicus TaxID=1715348 RepID=A0A501XRM9_9SPHN|nr:(d)CMP kinase [Sandaracinobacter neustonicus]TPE62874.1 (d)CMP kinase [Sandaracinobacter neustonicus]
MPLIAVDGPAASGKGTIARALGRHFGVPHLDTGALYRVVALSALRSGLDLSDGAGVGAKAAALDLSLLEDAELRGAQTGEAASLVSALPEVRSALLAFQKAFAAQPGGAVLDGRDIGTVIAPEAAAKLFVTAAAETRARRRFLELTAAGRDVSEERVLADILARDARDMGRADAPLRQAADADLLDTSELDIAAAVRKAVELVSSQLGRVS